LRRTDPRSFPVDIGVETSGRRPATPIEVRP
jgi:hypothetical protein